MFYSCDLNNQALNQPKGGDYNTSILGQCKAEGLINVFGDGPIKHAHHNIVVTYAQFDSNICVLYVFWAF